MYNKLARVTILALACFVCVTESLPREAYMSTPSLIAYHGYPVEKHKARTDDGYILHMHRIPGPRGKLKRAARYRGVVLLMHGLAGSSSDFVVMGPKRSLAYLLADAGYDVWLGNFRGTKYSSHMSMSKNVTDFWNYSFHEHGTYDVPACIDTAITRSGQRRLLYIGYSMGTSSFFVAMSERPEYNRKVIAFVALAPAVYMDNMRDLANSAFRLGIPEITERQKLVRIYPQDALRNAVVGSFCQARRSSDDICMRIVYLVVGEDYEQNDWDAMPIILSRFQPIATKQLFHFGQLAMTGTFARYAYNLNRLVPYDLNATKVPVTLFYGENDRLTVKSQVLRLAEQLKSSGALVSAIPVLYRKFNHLDFVYAKEIAELLNKDLVQYINKLYIDYR